MHLTNREIGQTSKTLGPPAPTAGEREENASSRARWGACARRVNVASVSVPMDLIAYIGSLPPVKITRLYENEFTCLAVLRSLEALAKQYVFRLINLDESIPQGKCAGPAATKSICKVITPRCRPHPHPHPSPSCSAAGILGRSDCSHQA